MDPLYSTIVRAAPKFLSLAPGVIAKGAKFSGPIIRVMFTVGKHAANYPLITKFASAIVFNFAIDGTCRFIRDYSGGIARFASFVTPIAPVFNLLSRGLAWGFGAAALEEKVNIMAIGQAIQSQAASTKDLVDVVNQLALSKPQALANGAAQVLSKTEATVANAVAEKLTGHGIEAVAKATANTLPASSTGTWLDTALSPIWTIQSACYDHPYVAVATVLVGGCWIAAAGAPLVYVSYVGGSSLLSMQNWRNWALYSDYLLHLPITYVIVPTAVWVGLVDPDDDQLYPTKNSSRKLKND